jgi:hypothetical protein
MSHAPHVRLDAPLMTTYAETAHNATDSRERAHDIDGA